MPKLPVRSGRRQLLLLTAGATLAAMVSGCGGTGDDDVTVQEPGSAVSATPSASSPSTGAAELTVTSDDGTGTTTEWTLSCGPDGAASGTHPDPDKACAILLKNAATSLPPVAADAMCTAIFGGAQTARITGTYAGAPITSTFSRENGCEISRWDALAGVLPKAGGPQ